MDMLIVVGVVLVLWALCVFIESKRGSHVIPKETEGCEGCFEACVMNTNVMDKVTPQGKPNPNTSRKKRKRQKHRSKS